MFRKIVQTQLCQASRLWTRRLAYQNSGGPRSSASSDGFMSRSEKCLNSVQILGRVGQEPRVAGSSRKVVQFSVATTSYYQPSNESQAHSSTGDLQSKTSWHNIAVFRPYLQEKVENYVKKGSRVLVQGSLEYSTYTDEKGNQRNNVSIIPDDIIILATPGRDATQY